MTDHDGWWRFPYNAACVQYFKIENGIVVEKVGPHPDGIPLDGSFYLECVKECLRSTKKEVMIWRMSQ